LTIVVSAFQAGTLVIDTRSSGLNSVNRRARFERVDFGAEAKKAMPRLQGIAKT
jgi:hypothetical protein